MTDYYLFSGGRASLVATHYATQDASRPVVVYLDTGTGLQENREFVRKCADTYDWHLWELRTPENYADLVQQYGFPGPSVHSWFYAYLKERQLGKLATVTGERPHFYTGVYARESDNRMGTVERVHEADRWTWHAPLHDWTRQEIIDYHDSNDLLQNDVWDRLHMSGDCLCGAYGTRNELLDIEAHYPDAYQYIQSIESDMDRSDRFKWAWHSMSDTKQRSMRHERDKKQFTLCDKCWYQ